MASESEEDNKMAKQTESVSIRDPSTRAVVDLQELATLLVRQLLEQLVLSVKAHRSTACLKTILPIPPRCTSGSPR